jgi:hypothetical protein
MSGQLGQRVPVLGIRRQLLLLALEREPPQLVLVAPPLVLAERHDTGEVSLGQALELLNQAGPATPQIGAPCLQLLRQPVTAACPLHGMGDDRGILQHRAQIAPDQLLQRSGRDVARRTALPGHERPQLRLGAAQVVVVAGR